MVMIRVKGRKDQQSDVNCSGSQHPYRGVNEKNKILKYEEEAHCGQVRGEGKGSRRLEGLQEAGEVQPPVSFEAPNVPPNMKKRLNRVSQIMVYFK